jgi:hypothetical protein
MVRLKGTITNLAVVLRILIDRDHFGELDSRPSQLKAVVEILYEI